MNVIDMHQQIYVDDIFEIHVVQNPPEVPTLLNPFLETQKVETSTKPLKH